MKTAKTRSGSSKKQDSRKRTMSRRKFNVTVAAAALTAASARRVLGANERIHVGIIGCGGRSYSHMKSLIRLKEKEM